MSNKYLITKGLKEMDSNKVYHEEKDVAATLYAIKEKLKDDANKSLYNDWGVPVTALKGCDIKVSGGPDNKIVVQFKINEFHGGFRVPSEDPRVLEERGKDALKTLKKLEDAVKKEFKSRTGKTLKLEKTDAKVDWQLVALNGLYQFVAVRTTKVNTELEKHEFDKA